MELTAVQKMKLECLRIAATSGLTCEVLDHAKKMSAWILEKAPQQLGYQSGNQINTQQPEAGRQQSAL